MTNLKSLLILGLVGMGLLVSSCVKEFDGVFQPVTITPASEEIIETSLYGRVLDMNGQPILNALVMLNSGVESMDMTTDVNGQFAFEDIENQGASAFLSIQSPGKFKAFRRFGVIKNQNNYTEVKMQDKNIIGTVAASQGGTLDNGNGAEIELPANGVVDSEGFVYNGDVSVAMAWIDPTAEDLASQMVGDLSAIDSEGRRRALATYGMLQIELLDPAGNELNIADGSQATLQFPVPAELQSNAPSTIPLWSYNEVAGTWFEEGSAVFANGVYRGNVTHFSSWNVDFMYDPIEIIGQVKVNVEGELVEGSYLSVYVKSEEIGKKGGWLCDDGSFRFYNFPKGEQFKLCILDECGNVKFEETFGPYENDEDLGIIELSTSSNIIKVKGNALNCDGGIVEKGIVKVEINGKVKFYEMAVDGTFEFSMDVCEEGKGKATLLDTETSLIKEFEFDNSQAIWELNDLQLCDELSNVVIVNIEGKPEIFITPVQHERKTSMVYTGIRVSLTSEFQDSTANSQGGGYLEFNFKDPAMTLPETTSETQFLLSMGDRAYVIENEGDLQVTTTAYVNESGGFIKGTFTGVVFDDVSGASGIAISGSFRVPVE